MQAHTGNTIKLGIFVSVGLALLVMGVYLIGSRHLMFRQTIRISGIFHDVGGLQVGNNVRLSGVKIGTVDLVSIVSDSTVRVELVIDETKRQFIRSDAVASIGSEGLLGSKVLNISPGSVGAPLIENDGTIETALPIDLDKILLTLNTSITNTMSITTDMSTIMKSIRMGEGSLGKLIMSKTLAEDLDSSLANLKQSSIGLREIVDKAQFGFSNDLDSSMANLKLSTSGLKAIVDKAQFGFSRDLDSTMSDIRSGSQSFKLLMKKADKSWLLWGFN